MTTDLGDRRAARNGVPFLVKRGMRAAALRERHLLPVSFTAPTIAAVIASISSSVQMYGGIV